MAWARIATGAFCLRNDTQRILDTIIEPAIRATGFTGFLYAGLMMTADGPKVLEFNVRLGDPETQPLMHRLAADADFARNPDARGDGVARRSGVAVENRSVRVRGARGGGISGGSSQRAISIAGIENCGAEVFQAGTKMSAQGLETAGGRVLGVTASGADLPEAIANTYAAVGKIHFDGMQYRRDIGQKGLKRWAP